MINLDKSTQDYNQQDKEDQNDSYSRTKSEARAKRHVHSTPLP